PDLVRERLHEKREPMQLLERGFVARPGMGSAHRSLDRRAGGLKTQPPCQVEVIIPSLIAVVHVTSRGRLGGAAGFHGATDAALAARALARRPLSWSNVFIDLAHRSATSAASYQQNASASGSIRPVRGSRKLVVQTQSCTRTSRVRTRRVKRCRSLRGR